MEYFQKMQVCTKVPVQMCKDVTGKMPIKVRWIQASRRNPKCRSRLVAKKFRRYHDPDLFSSTPPVENAEIWRQGKSRREHIWHIRAHDVVRACFNAPSTSPAFVELSEEDRGPEDEGLCGELSAARNWQKCHTDRLCNCGGNACKFGHQKRDVVVMVHGDDFVWTADFEGLRRLESMLKETVEITTDIVGHDEESKKQSQKLNRFISVKDGGYTYEPDVRQSEMLVKELGAGKKASLAGDTSTRQPSIKKRMKKKANFRRVSPSPQTRLKYQLVTTS